MLRPDGISDLNVLQDRTRNGRGYPGAPPITLCAFDILVRQAHHEHAAGQAQGAARETARRRAEGGTEYVGHLAQSKLRPTSLEEMGDSQLLADLQRQHYGN